MIISKERRTIVKERVENTSTRRLRWDQKEELGIPRIFHKLHLGDHQFSSLGEVESAVQFTEYGDGAISNYEGEKEEVRLETHLPRVNTEISRSSHTISKAPIIFLTKVGNEEGAAPVAGFFPNNNYLIIKYLTREVNNGGERNGGSQPQVTLNKENIDLIKEIFSYIKKNGFKPLKKEANKKRLMMGCDPEFSLARGDERVAASTFLSGGTRAPLGVDGASQTGEIRPSPEYSPLSLVKKGVKPLLKELMRKIPPDVKATTGGGFRDPLGDHIHFNKVLTDEEVKLLDDFVGIPCTKMKGGDRNGYGTPGDVRIQPHGMEYRTCPSTLIPGLLEAKYVTAYCVIIKWERMKVGNKFEYTVDERNIPLKEDYLALAPTTKYKEILETFYTWVKHGEIDKKGDFLSLWFKRGNSSTKSKRPRAIVKLKPDWMEKINKISVKGLTEEKEVIIESYGPSTVDEKEEIPKGAVIISIPIEKFNILEENEDKANNFFKLTSELLNSHIALQTSSGAVMIKFPHTWRDKKRSVLSTKNVRAIVREALTL